MMAIENTATDGKQGSSEPSSLSRPFPELRSLETFEFCSRQCEVSSCPCSGRHPCVERPGHRWQPCRCATARGPPPDSSFGREDQSGRGSVDDNSSVVGSISSVQKKDVPTSLIQIDKEQEHPGSCRRCSQLCERTDYPCEGFGLCMSQSGHFPQSHQCRVAFGTAPGLTTMVIGEESSLSPDIGLDSSRRNIMSVIPRIFIEDAAARLRALPTDEERIRHLYN